jgi:hypothetical protein
MKTSACQSTPRMRRSAHFRPGVAIVTAVFMIAIVGLCLTVMARSYIEEVQLTAHAIARQQLSLLMDAGVQIVKTETAQKATPRALQVIALPPALRRQHGRLVIRLEASGPSVVVYQISGRFAGLHRQTFLANDGDTDQWTIR